jgi:hypothetical protein
MGKKTTNTKPATPAKRVAKTKPAAEKPASPAAAPESTPVAAPTVPKAKAKAAPRATKTVVAKPKKPAYSQEDIALRAYFIAERRQAAGLPGDSHQDWIEAERQLASEAATAGKSKTKKS